MIKQFSSHFCKTRHPIISPNVEETFSAFRFAREYYSYAMPMNNFLKGHGKLNKSILSLGDLLASCMQLANLHSYLAQKGAEKAAGKVVRNPDIQVVRSIFYRLNSRPDQHGKTLLDPADSQALNEMLGACGINCFCILFEHFVDEFRMYGSGDEVSGFDTSRLVWDAMNWQLKDVSKSTSRARAKV